MVDTNEVTKAKGGGYQWSVDVCCVKNYSMGFTMIHNGNNPKISTPFRDTLRDPQMVGWHIKHVHLTCGLRAPSICYIC